MGESSTLVPWWNIYTEIRHHKLNILNNQPEQTHFEAEHRWRKDLMGESLDEETGKPQNLPPCFYHLRHQRLCEDLDLCQYFLLNLWLLKCVIFYRNFEV